jgi:integrating conjugative element protein (TIGR03758 family)
MSTTTEAFEAATRTDPGAIEVTILMIVSAIALVLLAYVIGHLWQAHQDGELHGSRAGWYAAQAAVVILVLMGLLL